MNNSATQPPFSGDHCSHLGLEHDPATRLGYPSSWNYCHRATPSASVRLAHQAEYCQSSLHTRCVMFAGDKPGPLPPDIRESQPPTRRRLGTRALILASLVTLAVTVSVLGFLGVPTLLQGAAAQVPGDVRPMEQATMTPRPKSSSALAAPATPWPMIAPVTATFSIPTYSSSASIVSGGSPATALPTSTAAGGCGHQLDEPFGFGRKFLIHRVQSGDSLSTYATTYRTDAATIQRVNAHPLTALRPNEIVILPVDQKAVDGVPAFEAYDLLESDTTVGKVASMLASPNLDEFLLYNAISSKCPYFSGWVLVPRSSPAP